MIRLIAAPSQHLPKASPGMTHLTDPTRTPPSEGDKSREAVKTPSHPSRDAGPISRAPTEGEGGALEALIEAERFMAYFAGETRTFVGAGTPKTCLAMIRAAIAKAHPSADIGSDIPCSVEGEGSGGSSVAESGGSPPLRAAKSDKLNSTGKEGA